MERSTQRTVLVAVTTCGFLTAFVMSGINVALEQIASDLDLSAVAISWVSLASILATGVLLMPMARVADFRGRKFVPGSSTTSAIQRPSVSCSSSMLKTTDTSASWNITCKAYPDGLSDGTPRDSEWPVTA